MMFNFKFIFHRMLCILFLFGILSMADGQKLRQFDKNVQDPDIFRYDIQPMVFDGSERGQQLKSTRQSHGEHAPHIILEYKHLDKLIVADLFLNTRLLTDKHFLRSQNANGTMLIQTFNRTNVDLCHYKGQIRNNPKSKLAVSTCDGINGLVYDGNETYYIHSNGHRTLQETHYIQRWHDKPNSILDKQIQRANQSIDNEASIHEPYNANNKSLYVELVLVIDNGVYRQMNQNLTEVHKYCKDIANIVYSFYEPLNIFIALVGVVVWTEKDEITLSANFNRTLFDFSNYRQNKLLKDHPNDYAQLITNMKFDDSVEGMAFLGKMCWEAMSFGIATDFSKIAQVALVIAHEMGHNFGMKHDTDDCECPDNVCIMNKIENKYIPQTHWSNCSISQLNSHRDKHNCLRNFPKQLFETPTCGNGFVEIDEECDYGLSNECKNTCCDPRTCKLRTNATCDRKGVVCTCENGYVPPSCNEPSPGRSLRPRTNSLIIVLVPLFGILLFASLFMFIIYYCQIIVRGSYRRHRN